MNVRCKFICQRKEAEIDNEKVGQVHLTVVTDGSPENEEFFENTPGGELTLSILNQAGFAAFEEGKEYYCDITPAG